MIAIQSKRLELVPLTSTLVQLALYDRSQLGMVMDAGVPADWPGPDFLCRDRKNHCRVPS